MKKFDANLYLLVICLAIIGGLILIPIFAVGSCSPYSNPYSVNTDFYYTRIGDKLIVDNDTGVVYFKQTHSMSPIYNADGTIRTIEDYNRCLPKQFITTTDMTQ